MREISVPDGYKIDTAVSYTHLDVYKRQVRISYIDPIIDLTPAAVQSRVSEYIITIDRWATKRLNNQRLRILCGDGVVREQTIVNTGYGYKIHLEAIPVPIAEEYKEDEYGHA